MSNKLPRSISSKQLTQPNNTPIPQSTHTGVQYSLMNLNFPRIYILFFLILQIDKSFTTCSVLTPWP